MYSAIVYVYNIIWYTPYVRCYGRRRACTQCEPNKRALKTVQLKSEVSWSYYYRYAQRSCAERFSGCLLKVSNWTPRGRKTRGKYVSVCARARAYEVGERKRRLTRLKRSPRVHLVKMSAAAVGRSLGTRQRGPLMT